MNIMEHEDVIRFHNWLNLVLSENMNSSSYRLIRSNITIKLRSMLSALAKDTGNVHTNNGMGPKAKQTSGSRATGKTRRKRVDTNA